MALSEKFQDEKDSFCGIYFHLDVHPSLLKFLGSEGFRPLRLKLEQEEVQFVKQKTLFTGIEEDHQSIVIHIVTSQWNLDETEIVVNICSDGNRQFERILRQQLAVEDDAAVDVQGLQTNDAGDERADEADSIILEELSNNSDFSYSPIRTTPIRRRLTSNKSSWTTKKVSNEDDELSENYEIDESPSFVGDWTTSTKKRRKSQTSRFSGSKVSLLEEKPQLPVKTDEEGLLQDDLASSTSVVGNRRKKVSRRSYKTMRDRGIYDQPLAQRIEMGAAGFNTLTTYKLKIVTSEYANKWDFLENEREQIQQLVQKGFGEDDGIWRPDGKPFGSDIDEDDEDSVLFEACFNWVVEMISNGGVIAAICTLCWDVDCDYWVLENYCVREPHLGLGPHLLTMVIQWLQATDQKVHIWMDVSRENRHCLRLLETFHCGGSSFGEVPRKSRKRLSFGNCDDSAVMTSFVYPVEFLKLLLQ